MIQWSRWYIPIFYDLVSNADYFNQNQLYCQGVQSLEEQNLSKCQVRGYFTRTCLCKKKSGTVNSFYLTKVIGTLFTRARWVMPPNHKNKNIALPLLYLERNFYSKAGLFFFNFLFEHSFGCHLALLVFRPYSSKIGSKTIKNVRFLKYGWKATQKC